VQIDLIIRGMCCLRPGIEGVSENIRVHSIIGRFLEHTRTYYFANSDPQVYCASADLMERNLNYRVETCFPIEQPELIKRIKKELDYHIEDGSQRWILGSDGNYTLIEQSDTQGAQQRLLSELSGYSSDTNNT